MLINLYKASIVAAALAAATAQAEIVTFEDQAPGTVVTNQYQGIGLTIETYNAKSNLPAPHYGVLYDTTGNTPGNDNDLESPWVGGNLGSISPNYYMGNALIIQEANNSADGYVGSCNATSCSKPDDQAGNPAGYHDFVFDDSITAFGFDVIDVQLSRAISGKNSDHGVNETLSSVTFFDSNDDEIDFGAGSGKKTLFELLGNAANTYGNNSLSRVSPIDLSGHDVSRVRFDVFGTLAIDNVHFTREVSEPGSIALIGLGLFGLAYVRRKRS